MIIKKIFYYFEHVLIFFPLLTIFPICLYFILTLNLPDFLCQYNVTQRTLVSNLLSVIIAIILIYFGYLANKRLQYFYAVKAILQEMKKNHDRMQNFPEKFHEAYNKCEKIRLIRWIEKSASYTNWGDGDNFHLKYLPSQAYFDFINKGYINQTYHFFEFPSASIAHFYQFCMEFSRDLQKLENGIWLLESNKKPPSIIIHLFRFPDTKEFKSSQEICEFLTGKFYPFYAKKNDFNDGIIREYEKTIESLKDHIWLIPKEETLIKMNPSIEKKIIDIVNELKERNHIVPHRKIKASKNVPSFKASVFTSNTISYNPNLSGFDDDMIRYSLLHEEGHLQRKQYGLPALCLLLIFGLTPLVYSIISGAILKVDFSIFLVLLCFALFVIFSSFRILTEPFYWDEYGSDEFASKILRDNYNIKKPSEIVKKTLNIIPPSFDTSFFLVRLFLAFVEYHPSDQQRIRNIIEVIDEK